MEYRKQCESTRKYVETIVISSDSSEDEELTENVHVASSAETSKNNEVNDKKKEKFKELCKTEERYIQSLELLNYASPKNTRDREKDNNEGCELMFTESKRRTRR